MRLRRLLSCVLLGLLLPVFPAGAEEPPLLFSWAKDGKSGARRRIGAKVLEFELNQINRLKAKAGPELLDPQIDRAQGLLLLWPGRPNSTPFQLRRAELNTIAHERSIWLEETEHGQTLNVPLPTLSNDGSEIAGIVRWTVPLTDPRPRPPADGGPLYQEDPTDMLLVGPLLYAVRLHGQIQGAPPLVLADALDYFDLGLLEPCLDRLGRQYRTILIRTYSGTVVAEFVTVSDTRYLVLGASGTRFHRTHELPSEININTAVNLGNLLDPALRPGYGVPKELPSMESDPADELTDGEKF